MTTWKREIRVSSQPIRSRRKEQAAGAVGRGSRQGQSAGLTAKRATNYILACHLPTAPASSPCLLPLLLPPPLLLLLLLPSAPADCPCLLPLPPAPADCSYSCHSGASNRLRPSSTVAIAGSSSAKRSQSLQVTGRCA